VGAAGEVQCRQGTSRHPNLAGGAGAQPLQPGKDDKGGKNAGQGTVVKNNVTVNQASQQPSGDITHHLDVMHQNVLAMGR
jgi:hypothetical protein